MRDIGDPMGTLRQVGELLRDWRQRRHMTQRDLATAAGISSRMLGAIETGRELPSREGVLRLTERLEVPLRACNAMLIAAGYQPAFPGRLPGDPVLAKISALVEHAVGRHVPFPALALDRRWGIAASNGILRGLIEGIDPALLSPPINWARAMLHPAGLAPRIANLDDWRGHILKRLGRHFDMTGDPAISDLVEEIADYPVPAAAGATPEATLRADDAAVPLRLATVNGLLSFYGATSVFGSATDIALSELTIEVFYPADEETASIMRCPMAPPAAAD